MTFDVTDSKSQCPRCDRSDQLKLNTAYDTVFCGSCLIWLEPKCNRECHQCDTRPVVPQEASTWIRARYHYLNGHKPNLQDGITQDKETLSWFYYTPTIISANYPTWTWVGNSPVNGNTLSNSTT